MPSGRQLTTCKPMLLGTRKKAPAPQQPKPFLHKCRFQYPSTLRPKGTGSAYQGIRRPLHKFNGQKSRQAPVTPLKWQVASSTAN
eukprot:1157625-Pelagomonas_calceolata.AAC.6